MNNQHAAPDEQTPAVLPHLVIQVREPDLLDALLDGHPVPTPADLPWTRGRFAELIDQVTCQRTIAIRVEVHETDGTIFTDLIGAHPTPPRMPQPPPNDETAPARRHRGPRTASISASGFLPGEDVAIAIVVATTQADDQGQAQTNLSRRRPRPRQVDRAAEVVLFGRSSGTLHARPHP